MMMKVDGWNGTDQALWMRGIFIVIYALLIFVMIRLLLSRLIFPRLKLMFKIINDTSTKTNSKMPVGSDSDLVAINREVMEWAAKRRNELEDLKKLEQYRRNYLGDISHELKTPLFSIQGYLHTLLDGGLEDENINRRYIEKAVANAERLQLIVDDLETINRLEDDNSLNKSEFNIKRLIQDVINDLEIMSKEHKVKLVLNKAPDQGLWVEADKDKIRQVVENLLTNTIKYGVEEGKTKINLIETGSKLTIEISDNGIGIEQKHLKHLFDRFYRVDKSRARNLGGSGLGLSIVKHIIEAHDEQISVTSEPKKGSTFTFTLPKMKYEIENEEN